MGVASATLSGPAQAAGFTYDWIGTGDGTGPDSAWNQLANWASIPGGATLVPSYEHADSVNITGGVVNVGQKGLGAAHVDVSGGNLHVFAGKNFRAEEKLTVGGAGVVYADGTIDAGSLLMQGGRIEIMAPTNGKTGSLNVGNEFEMQGGVIDIGGTLNAFTMAMSGGTIQGSGNLAIWGATQTGGEISGPVFDITYYNYFGGHFSGTANIYENFVLGDNYGATVGTVRVDAGTIINGIAGEVPVVFNQDGNTAMSGAVSGFDLYEQKGGLMDGAVSVSEYQLMWNGTVAGAVDFTGLFTLSDDAIVTADAILTGGDGSAMEQLGGSMNGSVSGIDSYTQSGGTMAGYVSTKSYDATGGSFSGSVEFSEQFALSGEAQTAATTRLIQTGGTMYGTVAAIDTYKQSGGSIAGTVSTRRFELAGGTGEGFGNVTIGEELLLSGGTLARDGLVVPVFTQSGGSFSGSIAVDSHNLTGTGGSFTGSINASDAFNLAPASGTATVNARLTGTGQLVKDGNSTVTLTNTANNFSGGVAIKAGVLEVIDGALPAAAAVTVDKDAALQLTTNNDTLFTNSMTGKEGDLIKAGSATATLGGTVDMGDLWLNAGRLNIGTGNLSSEAVFETAVIATDATLYIASGATLTIRVPKHIINNGTLINDGTVHDDLDNHGTFTNNKNYNADVSTNTGTIDNKKPGYWTGDVESNAGRINNAIDATWKGAVEGNTGSISNNGIWLNGTVSNGTAGVDPGLDWGKVIYNSSTGTWHGDIAENYSWIINAGGTWTGDVLSNHRQIWNDNEYGEIGIGYWIGDIVSNDDTVFNGGGGVWTGDVLGNAGYIKNDYPAVWTGGIYGNDANIENRGIWGGDVVGNSHVIANTKTWNGAVVAAGSVTSADTGNVPNIGNVGNIYNATDEAIWTGDVRGNTGRIDNRGGLWDGDVLTNAGTISNAEGTINGLPTGDSTWTGDVKTNAGTIINGAGSTWTGDVVSNTGTIDTAGEWTGDLLGSYAFNNAGTVNARGKINAAVDNSGLFALTGSLSGISTFDNSGTLRLAGNGATQTLTVDAIVFTSASILELDIDGVGGADKIIATSASLAGRAKISAAVLGGSSDYVSPHTVVSADAIAGDFDSVTTDLAFFTADIDVNVGHTEAILTLTRNGVVFSAVGKSENQKATAGSIAMLDPTNPIYNAILGLTEEQAQQAFDALSGEAFASEGAVAINTATLIGGIAIDRMRQLFGSVDDGGSSASGYAAAPAPDPESPGDTGFWTQFYGDVGLVEASGDMAGLNYGTGGGVIGLDGVLGDWRLGATLHAGVTGAAVDERSSISTSTDYGIGVYGGREWGDTRLSLGGDYTRHAIRSEREVVIPGLGETLSAAYGADTVQAFGEVSHEFDFGALSLTPFAGLAYVSHRTDGFSETGGAAALTSSPGRTDAIFTTLGASIDGQFVVADDMLLTAMATLGWRHAFADAPTATNSFASGSSFGVVGMPIASDMFVLGAGLNLDISPTSMLDLSYDGQFGGTTQIHALQGTWSTRF